MKKQNYKPNRLLALLLFVFISTFSGCEKDPFINELHLETIPQEEYAIQKDKALTPIVLDWDKAMEDLTFQNLLSETGDLNSNELILKGAKKKKSLKINKSKVKKIKRGNYESYTIIIDSIDFKNLSISNLVLEKRRGKSNAYIFTYFPTKGWISNYTNGIFTDFEGKINVEKVNLDDFQLKSALVCESYFILIEHECTAGANHTVDEIEECEGDHSQLPYVDIIEITHCKLVGDSGGATYDSSSDSDSSPSGGGLPPSGEGSTPSDEGSAGAEPTISPFLNPLSYDISFYETISTKLGLSTEEELWMVKLGRDPFLDELYLFLDVNNSSDAYQFAYEIFNFTRSDNQIDYDAFSFVIQAFEHDKIYNSFDDAFINSVNQYMATPGIDAIQLQMYFSTQCAVLRYNHPNWSDTKIYWEASKDIVHITLDVFGMIPVVGEIADLTNGVLYTIEGDGLNATLSFAATIPVAGWAVTGTKYAVKVVNATTIGTKVRLTWKVLSDGAIYFGSSGNKLRKALGITDSAIHAHHLVPWEQRGHSLVQKAAKSGNAFHINEALNGIPRPNSLHLTGHSTYNSKVKQVFDNLYDDTMSVDEAYDELFDFIEYLENLIQNNSSLNSGQIANLISYP